MPILKEIKRRMVPEKTLKEKIRRVSQNSTAIGARQKIETLDSVHEDVSLMEGDSQFEIDTNKKQQADMKNILGYLNQGEWT